MSAVLVLPPSLLKQMLSPNLAGSITAARQRAIRAVQPGLSDNNPIVDRGGELPSTAKGAPDCADGLAWTASPDCTAPRIPNDAIDDKLERLSEELTNQARSSQGLPELAFDEGLRDVGRAHSEQMFQLDFFAHDDPDGRAPGDRVHAWHRTLVGSVGENIWMCRNCLAGDPDATAARIVTGPNSWMLSPPHRANILRDNFTHMAIGIAVHGNDLWATQVFSDTRGYLVGGLPESMDAGDCLLLELLPFPDDSDTAEYFELISGGSSSLERSGLGWKQIDASGGKHQLHFWFSAQQRSFTLVAGPQLQIL
ncbi:MAG: CAP domain-containing protein [Polyangiaceae bacterium]|nr:CAP domain-containing protein [Polyangiaceae bacterium]